ncbi:ABC transporter permease [Thioflexithrix psekupsensis]|uniref:ABC transporter permease n=1 Tax=Thioflexithrix psekupsensis TaxID=1570016 RepID=A0A251X7U3_9GAMM|nr:ABC transporter permease [Thioflexithrix psekupsensis]OUD14119.1 ABC transporter permease [Thioflexithrix psekupsensis]
MDNLIHTARDALFLLFSGDAALWTIVLTSLKISLLAMFIATPVALLLAFVLAFNDFWGRRFIISCFNISLAIPTVVVGLLIYMLLSRQGPLGDFRLLFTQTAMVIAQVALSFPVLVAMGHVACQAADRRAWETAITLGASPWQALFTVMYEIRFGLLASVIAAFSRIISEVGSAMMVGGNILDYTRNITTAIALETSKGMFAQGVALGIVLLLIALVLNGLLSLLQGQGQAAH